MVSGVKDKESKESKITPWEVKGEVNYDKLVKEFGVSLINEGLYKKLSKTHPLLRRKVYFSHRDFDKWMENAEKGKRVSVLTGRDRKSVV